MYKFNSELVTLKKITWADHGRPASFRGEGMAYRKR